MIQPLENYLVLEEVKANELLKSAILLGDDPNMDKPNIAIVKTVGPQVTKVKEGDRVLFLYHMFTELTLDKVKYLIGKDEGIIAYA